jgi:murein DD-endopeptidase MepM/ murein hydrolase activator NlpD
MFLTTVINGRAAPDVNDEDVLFRLPLATDPSTHFYFDRDPAAGSARAWDGSGHTYDGHTGSDFSTGPRGLPIYAAADGILVARVDGYGDMQGPANGNYIKLNHGNDRNGIPIYSFYLHMTAGSPINLPLGSFIAAGTQIGGIGTSGNSTGFHLHFHLSYNGVATDPFASPGEISWWANQGSGHPSTATPAHKFAVGDYAQVFALINGDQLNVRGPNPTSPIIGYEPNGAIGQIIDGPSLSYINGDYTGSVYTRYKIQFPDGLVGWAAQNWLQANAGPQDIEVSQGGSPITDGQANVINFGTIPEHDPAPTRIFTVTNVGGQTLNLSTPTIPSGYSLIEGLASSLTPGASDTFTVRLDNTGVGTKSGSISFTNNDPDESPFNFPITGTVTTDTTHPTVDIVDITPDPYNGPLNSFTIVFSERVHGLTTANLQLTRNGGAIALTGAQALSTTDNTTYVLNNLAPLTAASGTYTLTLPASPSLWDDSGNTLDTGATETVKVQTNLFRGDAIDSGAADSYYLRRTLDGAGVEIFENVPPGPVPTYLLAWAGLTSLTFDTGGGNNSLTIDYSRLNPVPAGATGLTYLATGNGDNALNLTGNGTFTLAADASINTPNLSITSAGTNVTFNATQHLAALVLHNNAAGKLNGINRRLVTRALTIDGGATLDIGANPMIVDYNGVGPQETWNGTAYAGVTGLIAAGSLFSSTATAPLTTLAAAESADVYGLNATQTATYANEVVDSTSVIVKYTYSGDANLDGKLNVDDYGRVDINIGLGTTGWFNGDFNLDGKVNVDDYGVIDSNVGIQGVTL